MIAVFGTNILVAAFVSEGVCSKLLRRGRNRQFSLVTCPFILHEFQQILTGKFKATRKEIQEAVQLVRQAALIMVQVWLPFSFNYTDVGSDKYFTSFGLAPNLFHRFSQTMGYGVEVRFGRRYGWLPQIFPQFYDYTSRDLGASLGYYYFLAKGGYLQARLSYDYVGAQGSNNDASRYSLLVSGEYPFTSRLSLLLYLDLAYLDADHNFRQGQLVIINPNLPPNVVILVPPEPTFPQRRDKNVLFGVIGTVKIYRGLQGSLHYYFTRHGSNLAVYDYTSHIFGAQIAYNY